MNKTTSWTIGIIAAVLIIWGGYSLYNQPATNLLEPKDSPEKIHNKLQDTTIASSSSIKHPSSKINAVASSSSIPEMISKSGTVLPGETITLRSQVLSWSMSCVLNWDTEEQLDMSLIDPDGYEIPELNRIEEIPMIAYNKMEDIQSGTWTIQIKGENLTQAANYNITIIMYGALVGMSAETDRITYGTGDAVTICADIKENESGTAIVDATATATIVLPDESTQAVSLFDDGTHGDATASDGRYTNNAFVASAVGEYTVNVHATGSFSGSTFSRDRDLFFKAIESGIQFDGTVNTNVEDLDADEYYDNLMVELGVNVIKPGKFTAVGSLYDSTGKVIQANNVTVDMVAGSNTMQIRFSGKLIRKNGIDGPFTVKDLILLNENGDREAKDSKEYSTNAYSFKAFERKDILLGKTNADQGVDTNSNSLYDYLRVTLGVDVLQSGTYEFNAHLLDSDRNEIVWATGSANLGVGAGNIVLDFDGQHIRRSLDNGSYTVADFSITGEGAYFSERNVYTTNSYRYEQFETIETDLAPQKVTFSKPSVLPGETIRVSAIIKNIGNPTSGKFNIQFYNGSPYASGTQIGDIVSMTGLDTGQEKTAEVNWDTSALSDGEYKIYVYANYDKALAEFKYNNNLAHETLKVGQMERH